MYIESCQTCMILLFHLTGTKLMPFYEIIVRLCELIAFLVNFLPQNHKFLHFFFLHSANMTTFVAQTVRLNFRQYFY